MSLPRRDVREHFYSQSRVRKISYLTYASVIAALRMTERFFAALRMTERFFAALRMTERFFG